MFYNNLIERYLSTKKMREKIKERFYWPQYFEDIRKYVESCHECQIKKPLVRNNILHPVEPGRFMTRWGVDLVGPLPVTARGNKYIIVAVEYLSKWQEARPVQYADASSVANFLYSLICRYGRIDHLHTDRGTEFVNEVIKELTSKFGMKHHMSTPYHPQANGLVERFNKSLCDSLVKLADESDMWDELIEPALFAHRTAKNRSIGLSPYILMYGVESQFSYNNKQENPNI